MPLETRGKLTEKAQIEQSFGSLGLLEVKTLSVSQVNVHKLLKHNSLHAILSIFPAFKQTIILIDGKRVKLQLWDTSGQGRFCTIIRSYSRGAQGILLVYDITNKWSFEGINRWLKEVDQVLTSRLNFIVTLLKSLFVHFILARARNSQGSRGKPPPLGIQAAG